MKLYTVVIHYLQMCMKEYGCCPKFGRGNNLTYTLQAFKKSPNILMKILNFKILKIFDECSIK
jgi:hypothetical protein